MTTAGITRCEVVRAISVCLMIVTGPLTSPADCQNLTPGDDVGADHRAFVFSPFRWQGERGEAEYRDHVTSAPGSGQQYSYTSYQEAAAPAPSPTVCTMARFYDLIHNQTSSLGTLLITTHGNPTGISVESYAVTPAGRAARDAAYDSYVDDPNDPNDNADPYTPTQVYKGGGPDFGFYSIGVRDEFIETHGRLTQGLVYVGSCNGAGLTGSFETADARVAVGNSDCPSPSTQKSRVTTFFERMDGKHGKANRPVAAAMAGLTLAHSGKTNTTLAPAVLWLAAPCPIKTGDIVTYKLDTRCEVGITPDIVGIGCTIENEVWLDGFTLQGTCVAPPPPGAYIFTLDLKWDKVYSDQNVARLDGNTNPPGSDAEGPAHDDYVTPIACPPEIWDCVHSSRPGTYFSPSIWTKDGVPIGETFPGGIVPPPCVRTYDRTLLPTAPNDWHWYVDFDWNDLRMRLHVWMTGFEPDDDLGVGIVCCDTSFDVHLVIDAADDIYQLTDSNMVPFHTGQWSLYPDDLPPMCTMAGGSRRGFIDQAIVWIDTVRALNGGTVAVPVYRLGNSPEAGGFDLLISYDYSALSFLGASRGALLDSLEWEYFTYRTGVGGNCPGGCPDGLVRLVAIADLDNGPGIHPIVSTAPGPLADLQFQVSRDRNLIGQCVPVKFYWADCGDNTFASVSGDTTYLDLRIYGPAGNLLWDEEDDINYPDDARPAGLGAPDECLEGGGPDKPSPIRRIIFHNGWVCIDEPPDDRGDINLNGIANEVGDAVLFTTYFIHGDVVWDPVYQEAQILATDINDDGIVLTVADLVYLIRIITGDEQAFPPGENPKVSPSMSMASVDWRVENDRLMVEWNCQSDAGAVLLAFNHKDAQFDSPALTNRASGLKVISHDNGTQLRVLVYGIERDAKIAAGEGTILTVPMVAHGSELSLAEVEAADYWGNPIRIDLDKAGLVPREFALYQNVPNPFNATTRIDFSVPDAGDVTLMVYNVLGQRVATVIDDYLEPGLHHVVWDARDDRGRELASGVYFYRIATLENQASRKMVLLK